MTRAPELGRPPRDGFRRLQCTDSGCRAWFDVAEGVQITGAYCVGAGSKAHRAATMRPVTQDQAA